MPGSCRCFEQESSRQGNSSILKAGLCMSHSLNMASGIEVEQARGERYKMRSEKESGELSDPQDVVGQCKGLSFFS
jgi:hypothetical protein